MDEQKIKSLKQTMFNVGDLFRSLVASGIIPMYKVIGTKMEIFYTDEYMRNPTEEQPLNGAIANQAK